MKFAILQHSTYGLVCIVAALAPLCPLTNGSADRMGAAEIAAMHEKFPGWPTKLNGKALSPEPMQPREERFYRDFIGKVGKFTDGENQVVIRWVPTNTRQFHLTTRCFRAIGYELSARPAYKDANGNHWSAFRATRKGESLEVRERIVDAKGNSWSDESAWKWATLWRQTTGPWWAYTVASK